MNPPVYSKSKHFVQIFQDGYAFQIKIKKCQPGEIFVESEQECLPEGMLK